LLVVEIFAYAIIVLDGKHHHVMQCSDEWLLHNLG
jgi:hypothetical protein